MSRNQNTQAQRSVNNPLVLGTFSTTSLRYLKGKLGPQNKVVGRADTSLNSNGGFGGGAYNNWFQVNITSPAWIILRKGPPRPNYIQISAYDLNKNPIEGEAIFDADSVTVDSNGQTYIPYLDTVMSTKSDLYNQFDALRLDRGDERYYPLGTGSYLICVSTTRNELLDYELGVVIEFPVDQVLFELEDTDGSIVLRETAQTSTGLTSPVTTAVSIPSGSYVVTEPLLVISGTGSLELLGTAIVAVGATIDPGTYGDFGILCDIGDDAYFDTIHDHSLSEWQTSWQNEHQDTDRFPDLFVPLTNRP
jgi:hypothetical protein